jgi:hypothetical protein
MNPVASTKCAGRLLMALTVIASTLLIASCGSSSSAPTPNNVGFNIGSLNGTYVFSSQGADAAGYPLAVAGAFVTVGTGSITGGTVDIIDVAFDILPSTPPATAAQSITGGSYTVGSDGRGRASLASAYGTVTLDFVLTSTSHGLVSEFDTHGTGSGTLDLQTAVTSVSQLAGPYAFSLAGSDGSANLAPFATAGAFNLNSSGSIIGGGGVEDFNDNGVVISESLSGVATLGSGTGPGKIPLTTTSFPLTFDFYPIDATHWKLIETDYNEFLAGDVFTATQSTVGTMVFTMAGGTSTTSVANGGLMTYNANSVTGSEDVNTDGTVLTQVGFRGTPGATGLIGGRVVVTLSDFVPATQWVIYPYSGGLLMLETDSSAVTIGAAFAQSATSFTASGGYGLNLSGINSNGPVNYIAQFNASSPTSSPNMSGILDDNEFATPIENLPLSGTYTPDSVSPATGRGLITAPTTGKLGTFLGALNLEYYVVDSSTVLFIDVDSAQVAVGTFQAQGASGSAAAQSRMAIVHPAVRAHGALRRK